MTEAEYREQLNALEEQLSAVYRERRKLTEAYADEHPAVLPAPRWRTDAQARVARCPRCGGRLEDDRGGAASLIEAGRPIAGDDATDAALEFISEESGAKI